MFRLSIRRWLHNKPSRILIDKDETCFVVQHPQENYAYEFTRPVPEKTPTKRDQSVLKVDSRHMITKSPNMEQVQALTYTPSSYWKIHYGKEKRARYKAAFDDNESRKGLTS